MRYSTGSCPRPFGFLDLVPTCCCFLFKFFTVAQGSLGASLKGATWQNTNHSFPYIAPPSKAGTGVLMQLEQFSSSSLPDGVMDSKFLFNSSCPQHLFPFPLWVLLTVPAFQWTSFCSKELTGRPAAPLAAHHGLPLSFTEIHQVDPFLYAHRGVILQRWSRCGSPESPMVCGYCLCHLHLQKCWLFFIILKECLPTQL